MVSDLNFNIEIKVLPTVREKNGLAMSSRNNYLSTDEREKAFIIYKALTKASEMFKKGEKDTRILKKAVTNTINKEKIIKIDYVEVLSNSDLKSIETIEDEALLAVSASIRDVHLIDNVVLSASNR